MTNTALRAENSNSRTITFKSREHEKFYEEYLKKCRYQDVYHRALIYCLGIDRDTRDNVNKIYNFKTGCVKTECLQEGWQTSGSLRIVRMAFNLYCNGTPSVGDYEAEEECYTVEDLFCCGYARYFWEAIKIRYAYKMKYDAMKHQGSKGEKYTADMVGETAGDSGRTVQRYIRLASLSDGLLEYVDDNKIPMIVGEKLSYLKPQEQEWLLEGIVNSNIFPTKQQAEQLKECSANGKLNQGYIYAILLKKENSKINVTIPAKKIGNYFPETYSKEQIEEVIFMLLDKWKQNREGVADAEDTV